MASFSSLRAFLPAAHGRSVVPVSALMAAARSGASFLVVCPADGSVDAVAAALQAATNGAGLVLSTWVVARAAKRSGGVDDGRTGKDSVEDEDFVDGTGEDSEEVAFIYGTGKDSEEVAFIDSTGKDSEELPFVDGTGKDSEEVAFIDGTGGKDCEEVSFADGTGKDSVEVFFVDGSGKDSEEVVFVDGTGNFMIGDTKYKAVVGEMTMDELVLMFHKETASLLRQVKGFPVGNEQTSLASLVASCNAVGEQIQKTQLMDSPEGRTTVQSLIALHMRIFSCAGGADIRKHGSSMPDIWSGHCHRLPCKEKRAGTLMELLLYSMMLAEAALDRFISVKWDFTTYG